MRPVVLQMGVTLDGFVHGAKGYEDWGLPPEEDAVIAWKVDSLRQAGTHIMGRLTYEAMAAVWPTANGVYADVMNEIPKVVFSATLTHADWGQTRMANGDLVNDIGRLKREVGGPILADGGATFIQSLTRAGLIDEYRLVIHPAVIGPRHWAVQLAGRAAAAGSGRGTHLPFGHGHPRLPDLATGSVR